MNSINIGAASAGSNLGLFKHNHGLSSSRHSVARSTYSNSSVNMAAAMVSSNQGKGSGDSSDDHHHHRLLPKVVNDPVELRTCTVDEAFRRMEELVGSEEEEKNWKGIVIALLVIAFILGMISMAIVLVTPAPEVYDPGEPLPFTYLTDKSVQLRRPAFSWVRGSDKYVEYVNRQKENSTDKFMERYAILTENVTSDSNRILLPQAIISAEMRGAEEVKASPSTNYALVKLASESDSITTKSTYLVYNNQQSSVIELSDRKLQFADWMGSDSELVYIQDNNIYYRESPELQPVSVTSDGSLSVLNGVPDKTYKVYIFPKLDSLLWPSLDNSKFVFARIDKSVTSSYSPDSSSSAHINSGKNEVNPVSLHVYNATSTKQFNLTLPPGYLSAVSWMDTDRVMVVWLESNHQTETYHICDSTSTTCQENFKYTSSDVNLNWVGLYGTPVYNADKNEYYTLLPDPANENKLYRHVAAIKANTAERKDPRITFLTSHPWSDLEILGLDNSQLYFLSTGSNFTHQHLYSLNIATPESVCLTCDKTSPTTKEIVTYVEAEFSHSYSYVYLSLLGPDIPTFHVLNTQSLYSGEAIATQIDAAHHSAVLAAYEGIHLPTVEFLTVPLDHGLEASVKLVLPSIFNREKSCLYEMIVIINDIPGTQIATQEFSLGFQEYLAKNQTFIIALADVRGSGGQGEKLRQAIYGKLGVAEARDISMVTSFLTEHAESYKVDENYIAVMGKEYGGFVSMHAASYSSVKCGVISAPISSLSKYGEWLADRYMHNTSLLTSELNYNCGETSISCSIPKASSVLMLHGTEDAVVAVDNSLELMRDLQKAGYSFRQQIYPDVGSSPESSDIAVHYYQTIRNYLSECFEVEEKIDESQIDFCANRE